WYSAATRRLCLLLQLRLCAPCQGFWLILGDQDRVLEVRRRQPICGAHRPAILKQADGASTHVDHRLNCERHSGLESRTASTFAIVWDLRLFMQLPSDAVSYKLTDH